MRSFSLIVCVTLLLSCGVPETSAQTNSPAATSSRASVASSVPPISAAATARLASSFPLADQAAALLPDFAGDIANADRWDRYSIAVDLNPTGLSYSGSMRVEVTNRTNKAWNDLYMHLYPNHPDYQGMLRVDGVRVNDRSVATTGEQGNVLLRVPLAQPLAAGGQVTVTMQFSGRSPRNASRQAYGAFNQEAGVWSLATFYPIMARYLGDGWDRRTVSSRGDFVVSDTSLYDVQINAPEGWVLATTGARVPTQQQNPAAHQGRFVSGPQREFLITALQGLDQASTTVDGTRITSYYQKGNAATGQEALGVAEQSIRIFNDRFGRYPLAELDVIQAALTSFAGVEYPGIILIEQSLYKRGNSPEAVVAHEVGHQWWYSLVGNDPQGDPWLDEGLTSYSEIVYHEGVGDTAEARATLNGFRESLRRARAAGRDGVVARPPTAFSGNYVVLVYHKPALFFQALRNRLGDDQFFSFVQSYYSTYRYGTATGPGLLNTAQQTCGCDLQGFYNDWITTSRQVALP